MEAARESGGAGAAAAAEVARAGGAGGVIAPGRQAPRARRWVFAMGAVLLVAVVVSALLSIRPLLSSQSELDQVAADNVALHRLADVRTTLADWQLFFEQRLALVSPSGAKIGPVELAKGAQIVTDEAAQGAAAAAALRAIGLPGQARDLDRAGARFYKAVTDLSPLVSGTSVAAINAAVNSVRTSSAALWTASGAAADEAARSTERDLREGRNHSVSGRNLVLLLDILFAFAVLVGAVAVGQRARRRERSQFEAGTRRAFEGALQEALDMAKSEQDVYDVLQDALPTAVPALQIEMLVADSSRAHFHRTLTTGREPDARIGCGVVGPDDCPATTRAHTLVFPSSRALNACPYLKHRASGECSGVCVPLSIGGNTVGITHATGADGVAPTEREVDYLQMASRRASERIAMVRAFEKSEMQAHRDPLTGLLNRRSFEDRVRDVQLEGIPYVLAYGDLDHFKLLNDTHGHEAGDHALRLFSRVLRDSVRPRDLVARWGGEEFVVMLPDCDGDAAVSVLERVRERLSLALTGGRVPSFTVSFGVASSASYDSFGATLAAADDGLLRAKAAGRNRVVVAGPPAPFAPTVAGGEG